MTAVPISAQSADEVRNSWITPQEQLDRLLKRPFQLIANEISREPIYRTEISDIANPDIANIISQYALSPNLMNWHTALKRLNELPDKIPPLPWNIHQILDGKCPIRSKEKQTDGTHYKIDDTHSLYLDPFPTINVLESSVSSYGQHHYPDENPLQVRFFWDEARQEHGNVLSNGPQWILISNDVLPESRSKSYKVQAQMVAELSAKAFVNYEVPSLKAAIAAIFLHKVATGASLYPVGDAQNGNVFTYTRVKETTQNWRLIVGAFAPSGLRIGSFGYYNYNDFGVAALREF